MSDEQPPSDEAVESTPVRQLLHAATGDREAEARALADRAGDDVEEEDARRAVGRAHGDRADGTKPESDLAEPADVEGADGG